MTETNWSKWLFWMILACLLLVAFVYLASTQLMHGSA